jgi:CheY-like chemotaxis protein
MDLRLPVLSGVDAARRIRSLDGGRQVKIVAVTASAFDSQREEVLASGINDFLRKPYRASEIFDCMALHLGVRYLYGQMASGANDAPALLRTGDLAALPCALYDELEQALISLDPVQIALVVGRISEYDASLGAVLAGFTEKFAFSPILAALKSEKNRVTKEAACQS